MRAMVVDRIVYAFSGFGAQLLGAYADFPSGAETD